MKISLCFCGKNLALVFPTFPSGKQFSAMHGTNGILNFSAVTDTVYSFALRNHAWRGKLKKVISVQYYPQDYCVSPSPLLALLGPYGVGTGLDWVGIGSGGIGD